MSEAVQFVRQWVKAHDELYIETTSKFLRVMQKGQLVFSLKRDSDGKHVSIGRDDGGIKGEIVGFEEDSKGALLVDGEQAWMDYPDPPGDSWAPIDTSQDMVWKRAQGRFAVWPANSAYNPEIDGPYEPEDEE